jgi:hypothetical protein
MNSFQMFSSFDPPLLQGAFDSDLEIDVKSLTLGFLKIRGLLRKRRHCGAEFVEADLPIPILVEECKHPFHKQRLLQTQRSL